MKRTPLRKISDKQKAKKKKWKEIFFEKLEREGYWCEWCKKYGSPNHPYNPLVPHHIDHNRNNNTYENCMRIHLHCHNEHHFTPEDLWRLRKE